MSRSRYAPHFTQEYIDLEGNPRIERQQFKDLIKRLLCVDPDQRISLEQALQHNFFDPVFEEEYEFIFEKISKYFSKDD